MNVIHVASEVHPFSMNSSLSESTGSLPRKTASMGHSVTVLSPLYSAVERDRFGIKSLGLKTWVDAGFAVYEFELFETEYKDVRYVFFKNDDLFNRIGLYGTGAFDYADNDIRFGAFAQAAMNYIKYHNIPADIIHCHDWQTALVPVYKKLMHNELSCKTVLTVHSIENLGIFNKFAMESLNLPWDIYNIDNMEYYDNISFLKGGIAFCDHMTTVSGSFAEELTTQDCGLGLDGLFAQHAGKLDGILNGISYNRWNPEKDRHICANFSSSDLSGKKECKKALTESLGLNPEYPLVCFVSKLTPARGVELVFDAVKEFDDLGMNLVVMGYTHPNYTQTFQQFREHTKNAKIIFGNYGEKSHNVYAAADIILMPSLYEPCGVGLLIGMRYGAIPVARNTGGLKDGVAQAVKNKVGFTFNDFSVESMMSSLKQAADLYRSTKRGEIVKKLMGFDYSWQNATKQYISLYKKIMEV